MQIVGIGKGVRVNTRLSKDVKKDVLALSKQLDVPQTVIINSLCALAIRELQAEAKVTMPRSRKKR